MKTNPIAALIPIGIAAAAASAALLYLVQPYWIGLAACAFSIAALLAGLIILQINSKRIVRALNDVMGQNSSAISKIISGIDVPALVYDGAGRIIWSNRALNDMYSGHDMKHLLPELDVAAAAGRMTVEFNGRDFLIISEPIERAHPAASKLVFQYWIDRTEALHYSRLYEEQMPTVALIYVDNYEELNADKQFHKNAVLAEVETLVSQFAVDIDGTYRRYDTSKFFVVFEAKQIEQLENQRFPLLDAAREISTGTDQTVTLSISVGAANRVLASDDAARQGMELALGRGGDQAIVKRGGSYSFYGGKRQVVSKNSRVRTRLFAKALRQLMENSDQIFVLGHKNPDMDCIGAALGLMRCGEFVGCRAYLVLDESNPMIDGVISSMRKDAVWRDSIRSEEQALSMLRNSSAVLVVDTQRESSVVCPELYAKASKTAIIDHHRRSVDALVNPTLTYLEAGASSTSEMVAEIIQYFDDSLRPTGFESCALLAGITLDTKHFAFNTGARTFEAASYLRRCGADNSLVKLMFQDDMQTYRNRADVVESAMLMERGIAVSVCGTDMENSPLIAAQAADELISIKGIRASFVLAQTGSTVLISGRSLGEINVQVILERLGGGGHLTVAGAQLTGAGTDDAMTRLKDSIDIYLKEADKQ